jgi:hypothetical protein
LAGERLKFRCYQCNQLLASSPGKAGAIVSCPRCKADLVVPAPDSAGPGDSQTSPVSKGSGRSTAVLSPANPTGSLDLDEAASAIPADLIDLRPEDLRVEAEFFRGPTRTAEPPRELETAPAPWVAQIATTPHAEPATNAPTAPATAPPEFERPPLVVAPEPAELRPQVATTPLPPIPSAPLLPPMSPEIPPIEIEPPTLRAIDRELPPLREVVLPAAVVLAWSLFGLIGIATSFIAGLMVGHYFWRM